MKNNKFTVTIGIPAFNEEANIHRLLTSILLQRRDNFILERIIVMSDGSTDLTVSEAKKTKNNLITVIDKKQRQGLNESQNQIIKLASSDVLIIFNSDILIKNHNAIENMVSHFYKFKNLGIVGARTDIIWPKSFIGRILANSHFIKQTIFQKYKKGDNVYLCHGSARAFAKAFYKKLTWPYNCPEDAYSYFACKKNNYKFIYEKNSIIHFSPSSNFSDHYKQSTRFFNGKKIIEKYFNKNDIRSEYKLPLFLTLSCLLAFIFKKPHLTIPFIFLLPIMAILSQVRKVDHSKYEISASTKNLTQ